MHYLLLSEIGRDLVRKRSGPYWRRPELSTVIDFLVFAAVSRNRAGPGLQLQLNREEMFCAAESKAGWNFRVYTMKIDGWQLQCTIYNIQCTMLNGFIQPSSNFEML